MDFRREKVRVCPESESIRAGLSGKEEMFLKRNETIERLGFVGKINGGLSER